MMDDYLDFRGVVEGSIFDYYTGTEEPVFGSALELLSRLTSQPDAEIDLAEAALTIASIEYPGLNQSFYIEQLDRLADEVRPLISVETDPLKNIASLNNFLTHNKGFHGNEADYNNRRNSYLNDVLTSHTGIPISLSLLYIELGKRLGLHFEGIGLPGHFIIRYREPAPQTLGNTERLDVEYDTLARYLASENSGKFAHQDILLDPFNGGNILSQEQCASLVRETFGRNVPLRDVLSHGVTNRQFLTRILNNLKAVCITEEDFERALQFQLALVILNPDSVEERRDRGMLYARLNRTGAALSDLQFYLRTNPTASDATTVARQIATLFDSLVKRN